MLDEILVTTGDLHQPYQLIGPVYFQVSNKGRHADQLIKLKKLYGIEFAEVRKKAFTQELQSEWSYLMGEWSSEQTDFELAFFIGVQELKQRGQMLGADAIIELRQNFNVETKSFAFFSLHMYGTAVKLL